MAWWPGYEQSLGMNLRELARRIAAQHAPPRPAPVASSLEAPDVLTVYGADWCADCGRAKRYLDRKGVPYRYVDLPLDQDAQRRLSDAGYRAIPVVAAPDGRILVEPSNAELEALLSQSPSPAPE